VRRDRGQVRWAGEAGIGERAAIEPATLNACRIRSLLPDPSPSPVRLSGSTCYGIASPWGEAVEPPTISVGTAQEYAHWVSELRKFLAGIGADARAFERVDARYNYKENRIVLYRLADPADETSVAETISHETLHALLYQMGERFSARTIDLIGKPVRSPARTGGI
jgi:hypothetical protein